MRLFIQRFSMFLVVQLFLASIAQAAWVTITPTGARSYEVQGSAMDGVAGIQLEIGYDNSAMSAPQVSKGSLINDALLVANTNIPGTIKVAIISPKVFTGNGSIVSILFNSGAGNGRISLVSSTIIDSAGTGITPTDPGLITTAGVPFSSPASATSTAITTTTGSVAGLGTVTMPADSPPRTETRPEKASSESIPPAPAVPAETPVPQHSEPLPQKTYEPEKTVEIKRVAYGGVVDRFRVYTGKMSPAIMMELFSQEVAPAIHQEPSIAVSDGKKVVTIRYSSEVSDKNSPNFTLSGATMVNIRKENDSPVWILEVLPKESVSKVVVTILTSSSVLEFPLTVVPPLGEKAARLPDFAAFIKDTGVTPPSFDLNGDGIHDYQDNFIYSAYQRLRTAPRIDKQSQKK